MKLQGNRNFLESVKHCLDGIFYAISKERNFKIEVICGIVALIVAFGLEFSRLEFILVLMCISSVLACELINTAIERCVDLVTEEVRELAKYAKDVAAGAVLIASFFALVIGLILYLPKFVVLFS